VAEDSQGTKGGGKSHLYFQQGRDWQALSGG
jgi:hypothetical protein